MEEINNSPGFSANTTPQPETPPTQPVGCPGNCKSCPTMQQMYCSAQMSRNIQDLVACLFAKVDALASELNGLKQLVAGVVLQQEAPLMDAPEPDEKTSKRKTKKPATD